MLVHPSTTNTPLRVEASHLLSKVLDVALPTEAKLDQIWTFRYGKRKRDDDPDEDRYVELEEDSLFSKSESIWHVIEWSFFKGEGGWVDLLSFIRRMLEIDFECVQVEYASLIEEIGLVSNKDDEATKEGMSRWEYVI